MEAVVAEQFREAFVEIHELQGNRMLITCIDRQRLDHVRPLTPPLSVDDAAWLAAGLKNAETKS